MARTVYAATQLLLAAQEGDRAALDRLLPVIFAQLRAVAARKLRAVDAPDALTPTELVGDAYLMLVDQAAATWQSRAHFCGIAAHLVRHILVDHARRRRTGDLEPRAVVQVTLNDEERRVAELELDVVALDEALDALSHTDAPLARVVELRYFGGLSLPSVAEVLQIDHGRLDREWRAARAWLHRYFKQACRDSRSDCGSAPADIDA